MKLLGARHAGREIKRLRTNVDARVTTEDLDLMSRRPESISDEEGATEGGRHTRSDGRESDDADQQ